MTKFLAFTFVYSLGIALGVAVSMYGWGLEPKSWWWIIGGGVAGRVVIEILGVISKAEK